MSTFRSLGFVFRRLGREFLLLFVLLVLGYIAVDQILWYRYQQTLAAWAERYAELFPEPKVKTTECVAVDALLDVHATLEEEAKNPVWGITPRPGTRRNYLSNMPSDAALIYLHHNVFGAGPFAEVLSRSVQPDAFDEYVVEAVKTLGPTLDTAIACGSVLWPESALDGAPTHYNQLCELLRVLLTSSIVMAETGDTEACTATLLRVGALWPNLGEQPDDVYQMLIPEWYFAAMHFALARNAITPDTVQPLLAQVVALRDAYPHPLKNMRPSYFEPETMLRVADDRPLLTRFARPLMSYEFQVQLSAYLRATEDLATRTFDERVAMIRVFAEDTPASTTQLEIWYPHILTLFSWYERKLSEFDIAALMLSLEAHRFRTGTYPAILKPITDFAPQGVDPAHYAAPPITYTPDADGQGYRIHRELPRVAPASEGLSAVNTNLKRDWIRRYDPAGQD